MKKITDPSFEYTPSSEQGPDYLERKFKKIRARLKEEERERAVAEAEAKLKIKQIKVR